MEWDGKVSAPAPVCRADGAALQPGQTVYSGLRLVDGVFERLDYAEAAWATLDRASLGLLSWWRRTIPLPEARQRALKLDAAVLTQLFTDLSAVAERPSQCFCYVIALLLVRIRRMKVLEIEDRAGEPWLSPAGAGHRGAQAHPRPAHGRRRGGSGAAQPHGGHQPRRRPRGGAQRTRTASGLKT